MSRDVVLMLVVLVCAPFSVQAQISPNPNPVTGSIIVIGTDDNFVFFQNDGWLQVSDIDGVNTGTFTNFGTLENNRALINYSGGILNNYSGGTLNNNATPGFTGDGLINYSGGTMNNSGVLGNYGALENYGTLSNSGGTLYNYGGSWCTPDIGGCGRIGGLTNSGTLNNSGTLENLFDLVNYGTLENNSGGTLNNSATLYNGRYFMPDMYVAGLLYNSGTLSNSGTLDNSYNSILNNSGTLDNSGEITGAGSFLQTAGETIVTGSMVLPQIEFQGGFLRGNGVITSTDTALIVASGTTVAPGTLEAPVGTLTLNADLSSSGNFDFEIGGLSIGEYDVLDVNGSADFSGGTMQFDFINGFVASEGDYWDFFYADLINGSNSLDFAVNGLGAGLGWQIESGDTYQRLLITSAPVPEPNTALLLGLGLMRLAASRKR